MGPVKAMVANSGLGNSWRLGDGPGEGGIQREGRVIIISRRMYICTLFQAAIILCYHSLLTYFNQMVFYMNVSGAGSELKMAAKSYFFSITRVSVI